MLRFAPATQTRQGKRIGVGKVFAMRQKVRWFCALVIFGAATSSTWAQQASRWAAPVRALFRQHLADYNSELRRADGRVDADATVTRLKELGVTTYYWLVWHAPPTGTT